VVTIISGTNRIGSRTRTLAEYYAQTLERAFGEQTTILDLADLPSDFISGEMYGKKERHPAFEALAKQLVEGGRVVYVFPEYNNSYPGVLKSFIDSFPYPNPMRGGVAAMVGISAGTNGCANGMTHLSDVLNYLGIFVLPQRLRIGLAMQSFTGTELSSPLEKIMREQMEQLLAFPLPVAEGYRKQ
jgi:chromate reductase, NAD(P)H dehydrogenase (quinone)